MSLGQIGLDCHAGVELVGPWFGSEGNGMLIMEMFAELFHR